MKILLGCLLLSASLIANAGNKVMNVATGQSSFVISLPANPTTGYQWSVVNYDKKLLTLSRSHYQKSQTQLIGSSGQMLFTFKLNKSTDHPKTTTLLFKYARSWEPNSATMKNVTVNFSAVP